jgi:hypothetical protein
MLSLLSHINVLYVRSFKVEGLKLLAQFKYVLSGDTLSVVEVERELVPAVEELFDLRATNLSHCQSINFLHTITHEDGLLPGSEFLALTLVAVAFGSPYTPQFKTFV